jgi:ABC-type oligopeptide transport system ATPase subunit
MSTFSGHGASCSAAGWKCGVTVSAFIRKGETLGLVGESGSGKTTTGLRSCADQPTSGRIWPEYQALMNRSAPIAGYTGTCR